MNSKEENFSPKDGSNRPFSNQFHQPIAIVGLAADLLAVPATFEIMPGP